MWLKFDYLKAKVQIQQSFVDVQISESVAQLNQKDE